MKKLKKIFDNKLFIFLLGIMISGGSVFAYSIAANEVVFNPENTEWKVTNVEEAVTDLYKYSRTNILEKLDLTSKEDTSYGARDAGRTVSVSLEAGNYLIIVNEANTTSNNTGGTGGSDDSKKLTINYSNGSCEEISTQWVKGEPSDGFNCNGSISYYGSAMVSTVYNCSFTKNTTVTGISNTSTGASYAHAMHINSIKLD